jgi:hypothetical protein
MSTLTYTDEMRAQDDMRAWLETQAFESLTDEILWNKAREIAATYTDDDATRGRLANDIAAYAQEWCAEVENCLAEF